VPIRLVLLGMLDSLETSVAKTALRADRTDHSRVRGTRSQNQIKIPVIARQS